MCINNILQELDLEQIKSLKYLSSSPLFLQKTQKSYLVLLRTARGKYGFGTAIGAAIRGWSDRIGFPKNVEACGAEAGTSRPLTSNGVSRRDEPGSEKNVGDPDEFVLQPSDFGDPEIDMFPKD